MKLIICEKPAIAKAIDFALGEKSEKVNDFTVKNGEYLITFLAGHILEHLQPEEIDKRFEKWSLDDLPIYFKNWGKKVSKGKRDLIANVKTLLKRDDIKEVINAGDMDDEGQLLVDEVLEYLGNEKKVLRLNTADTTRESMRENLKNLKDNKEFIRQGMAAEARGLCDMIFGFTNSRYFTIKSKMKQSIGRVQTPTLDLVVKRDREIENFVPKRFTTLFFDAEKNDNSCCVKIELAKDDELLDENGYLSDKGNIEKLKNLINNNTFEGMVETKREIECPPNPFNLQTLQLYMEKNFGITPSQTMELTQNLRDKYNAITYNRSECDYVPSSYYFQKDKHIKKVLDNLKINDFKIEEGYRAKCFNHDSDIVLHFAIIPQNISVDITKMTEKEKLCYTAIAKRYLMQFQGDNVFEKRRLEIDLKNERRAVANQRKVIVRKWSEGESEKDDETNENVIIPFLDGKGEFLLKNPSERTSESKPPKRYTQATLIKDMTRISRFVKDEKIKALLLLKDKDKTGDKGSIGTSATRDTCIKKLLEHEYLITKGKNIISTQKARSFLDALPNSVKGVDNTALWFAVQEKIADGSAEISDLCEKVKDDCIKIMKDESINVENVKKNSQSPLFETANSYCFKTDSGFIRCILKNNKFFESVGFKPSTKQIETLLTKGEIKKAKLKSAKTGKDFDAGIKIEWIKQDGKNFLSAKYNLVFNK